MHLWLGSFYFPSEIPAKIHDDQPIDVFICVCDHYEPERGIKDKQLALQLVNRWCDEYPKLYADLKDCNGRPPQHSFFFPLDEYQPEYLDALKKLCDQGFGDVDIHLHHRHDTPEGFREKMETFRDTLYFQHGLLRTDPLTGKIAYGFIHGNWALCNSLPNHDWCGVNEELTILKQTGCYADFTLPSAPSAAQTSTINSIYYAHDIPGQPKSHNTGIRAKVGQLAPSDSLLMIQGPLLPDWKNPRYGIFPRIENGDLHYGRPAAIRRFKLWMNANVHVAGQPNWKFIKLHTHGCHGKTINTFLGPEMVNFHQELAQYAIENPRIRYHYVTAWEMALLVRQAEAGITTPTIEHQISQKKSQSNSRRINKHI
jgi:hypothetical protein